MPLIEGITPPKARAKRLELPHVPIIIDHKCPPRALCCSCPPSAALVLNRQSNFTLVKTRYARPRSVLIGGRVEYHSLAVLLEHDFSITIDLDLLSDEIILYLDDDRIGNSLSNSHTSKFLLTREER